MKLSVRKLWGAALSLSMIFSSCAINRDFMFKTSTDHVFDSFVDSTSKVLTIQPNDVIQFRLFANDGFKLIDLVSEGASREVQILSRNNFNYYVESDGLVKLPLVGRVNVAGLSLRQAEFMLEDLFKTYYKEPFVQVQVVNRRVVVFPGGGGDARVITLDNNNTTLLEVLGAAGGLSPRGDARSVKLFRRAVGGGKRLVYEFDLSEIEGLKYGDIVMEGDDVVYVQPTPQLAREALYDLTPIIALLTSIVLVIGIVQGFN